MRRLHYVMALVLALILAAGAWADEDGKKKSKGKKKGDGVLGAVTAVDKDSITVKTMGRGKKGAPSSGGEEKKFKLTKDTKVERMSGGKGQAQSSPAKVEDIKTGTHVMVKAKQGSDVAEQIRIVPERKGKKKEQEN